MAHPMMPYRWQCEADRCYRQRDRAGRWHARGRDMGTDDPGAGNRYHPECRPDTLRRLRFSKYGGLAENPRGLLVRPDNEPRHMIVTGAYRRETPAAMMLRCRYPNGDAAPDIAGFGGPGAGCRSDVARKPRPMSPTEPGRTWAELVAWARRRPGAPMA